MLLLLNQHVLYVSQGIDVVVARESSMFPMVLLSVGAAGAALVAPSPGRGTWKVVRCAADLELYLWAVQVACVGKKSTLIRGYSRNVVNIH